MAQCVAPVDSEDEDIIDIPDAEKEADPWRSLCFGRVVGGQWFGCRVVDVVAGACSHTRLYLVRYSDGDMEHLTAEQIQACLRAKPPADSGRRGSRRAAAPVAKQAPVAPPVVCALRVPEVGHAAEEAEAEVLMPGLFDGEIFEDAPAAPGAPGHCPEATMLPFAISHFNDDPQYCPDAFGDRVPVASAAGCVRGTLVPAVGAEQVMLAGRGCGDACRDHNYIEKDYEGTKLITGKVSSVMCEGHQRKHFGAFRAQESGAGISCEFDHLATKFVRASRPHGVFASLLVCLALVTHAGFGPGGARAVSLRILEEPGFPDPMRYDEARYYRASSAYSPCAVQKEAELVHGAKERDMIEVHYPQVVWSDLLDGRSCMDSADKHSETDRSAKELIGARLPSRPEGTVGSDAVVLGQLYRRRVKSQEASGRSKGSNGVGSPDPAAPITAVQPLWATPFVEVAPGGGLDGGDAICGSEGMLMTGEAAGAASFLANSSSHNVSSREVPSSTHAGPAAVRAQAVCGPPDTTSICRGQGVVDLTCNASICPGQVAKIVDASGSFVQDGSSVAYVSCPRIALLRGERVPLTQAVDFPTCAVVPMMDEIAPEGLLDRARVLQLQGGAVEIALDTEDAGSILQMTNSGAVVLSFELLTGATSDVGAQSHSRPVGSGVSDAVALGQRFCRRKKSPDAPDRRRGNGAVGSPGLAAPIAGGRPSGVETGVEAAQVGDPDVADGVHDGDGGQAMLLSSEGACIAVVPACSGGARPVSSCSYDRPKTPAVPEPMGSGYCSPDGSAYPLALERPPSGGASSSTDPWHATQDTHLRRRNAGQPFAPASDADRTGRAHSGEDSDSDCPFLAYGPAPELEVDGSQSSPDQPTEEANYETDAAATVLSSSGEALGGRRRHAVPSPTDSGLTVSTSSGVHVGSRRRRRGRPYDAYHRIQEFLSFTAASAEELSARAAEDIEADAGRATVGTDRRQEFLAANAAFAEDIAAHVTAENFDPVLLAANAVLAADLAAEVVAYDASEAADAERRICTMLDREDRSGHAETDNSADSAAAVGKVNDNGADDTAVLGAGEPVLRPEIASADDAVTLGQLFCRHQRSLEASARRRDKALPAEWRRESRPPCGACGKPADWWCPGCDIWLCYICLELWGCSCGRTHQVATAKSKSCLKEQEKPDAEVGGHQLCRARLSHASQDTHSRSFGREFPSDECGDGPFRCAGAGGSAGGVQTRGIDTDCDVPGDECDHYPPAGNVIGNRAFSKAESSGFWFLPQCPADNEGRDNLKSDCDLVMLALGRAPGMSFYELCDALPVGGAQTGKAVRVLCLWGDVVVDGNGRLFRAGESPPACRSQFYGPRGTQPIGDNRSSLLYTAECASGQSGDKLRTDEGAPTGKELRSDFGEVVPSPVMATEGGDKFRRLFGVIAEMAGSQSCGSAYLNVTCTRKGKSAQECVELSPADFYQQLYHAGSSAGFMERARVYLLYRHVHSAAEKAAAAVIGAALTDDLAREAADNVVTNLYENPDGEFFKKLRSINREEALVILRDSGVTLTSAQQATIRRETKAKDDEMKGGTEAPGADVGKGTLLAPAEETREPVPPCGACHTPADWQCSKCDLRLCRVCTVHWGCRCGRTAPMEAPIEVAGPVIRAEARTQPVGAPFPLRPCDYRRKKLQPEDDFGDLGESPSGNKANVGIAGRAVTVVTADSAAAAVEVTGNDTGAAGAQRVCDPVPRPEDAPVDGAVVLGQLPCRHESSQGVPDRCSGSMMPAQWRRELLPPCAACGKPADWWCPGCDIWLCYVCLELWGCGCGRIPQVAAAKSKGHFKEQVKSDGEVDERRCSSVRLSSARPATHSSFFGREFPSDECGDGPFRCPGCGRQAGDRQTRGIGIDCDAPGDDCERCGIGGCVDCIQMCRRFPPCEGSFCLGQGSAGVCLLLHECAGAPSSVLRDSPGDDAVHASTPYDVGYEVVRTQSASSGWAGAEAVGESALPLPPAPPTSAPALPPPVISGVTSEPPGDIQAQTSELVEADDEAEQAPSTPSGSTEAESAASSPPPAPPPPVPAPPLQPLPFYICVGCLGMVGPRQGSYAMSCYYCGDPMHRRCRLRCVHCTLPFCSQCVGQHECRRAPAPDAAAAADVRSQQP